MNNFATEYTDFHRIGSVLILRIFCVHSVPSVATQQKTAPETQRRLTFQPKPNCIYFTPYVVLLSFFLAILFYPVFFSLRT
jgi:hypothetical protein